MNQPVRFFTSALALGCAVVLAFSALNMAHAFAREGLNEDDYAAGEPGDPAKPARTVEVTMTEGDGAMAYAPKKVDVKLGEQIEFIIKNAGALKHEFRLDTLADNAHHKIEMEKNPEMEHDDPNAQSVEPGKQAEILWKFSKPGIFEFACLIPGHHDAGMHGEVIVK
jgi:uncharacterized cupredoxin-like copper-binding protein